MNSNKKRVLILTVRWGHLSIARAAEASLKRNHKVDVQQVAVEKISDLSYTAFYRFFPNLWKIPFKLSERERFRKITNDYLTDAYHDTLKQSIEKYKPDIVINVYFAFIPALEALQKKYKFSFINLLTNPRTFSIMEVSSTANNLTFDKKAIKLCRQYDIPENYINSIGWLVRQEFKPTDKKEALRKKLGLDEKTLTISVIGGSEGTYNTTKILPAFLSPANPIQVVFVCGNNKALFQAVKTFSKIQTASGSKRAKIIPKDYIKDINKYLQASDLVIGKAGPNLLFETVATKTPFFAITHIAGQEDGNLNIIKEYKLGLVEENAVKAIKLLRKIIEKPQKLNRYKKPIEKMADYNSQAPILLNKIVKTSFTD